MKFKTTPLFKRMIEFYVDARGKKDPETGKAVLPTIYNNGSSRSAKTYTAIQVIITILNHNQNRDLYVAVLRDTLVDCRKYTFKDFKEALKTFDMIEKCDIVEHPNPKIRLWGNTIEFMGLPEDGKQPPRTDICFFNEATEIFDQNRVKGFLMRCEMLAIFDWNPSYSKHWVYDGERVFNSLFTRTTYLDNPFLTDMVVSNIESRCPWDFADSHIEVRDGFKVRVWDKPEDERQPNARNIEAGTADRWYWLVYGEGIPAAREGAIFPNVEWINEFPDTGYDEVVISLDLGFTSDPSALVRIGRNGMVTTIENMLYQPTKTPEICFESLKPNLLIEQERRRMEGIKNYDELWICCESQDRYGTEMFVDSLNMLASAEGRNWNFFKVSKISISAGVSIMQRFKMKLVYNKHFEAEQQNYVYKMYKGEPTNEPDPESKFNHIWDAARYGFQTYFYWAKTESK